MVSVCSPHICTMLPTQSFYQSGRSSQLTPKRFKVRYWFFYLPRPRTALKSTFLFTHDLHSLYSPVYHVILHMTENIFDPLHSLFILLKYDTYDKIYKWNTTTDAKISICNIKNMYCTMTNKTLLFNVCKKSLVGETIACDKLLNTTLQMIDALSIRFSASH